MSFSRSITLWCDGLKPRYSVLKSTETERCLKTKRFMEGRPLRSARYIARKNGWSRFAQRDLCPACTERLWSNPELMQLWRDKMAEADEEWAERVARWKERKAQKPCRAVS